MTVRFQNLLLLIAFGLLLSMPAVAQPTVEEDMPPKPPSPQGPGVQPPSQDMIAKNVGGLPVLLCKIRYGQYEIEGHLLVDIGLDVPLKIHKSTLPGLNLDWRSATGQRLDIEIDGRHLLRGVPLATDRYPVLSNLTKLYADDLDQVPVVGLIGPLAFGSNVVELDLSRELLRTMGVATDAARKAEMPFRLMSCGVVVQGAGPADSNVLAAVTTQRHDSALTPDLLALAREKDKAAAALKVGELSVGERAPVRFEPMAENWPATVKGIIGADALRNATVTVWPERNRIAFQPRTATPVDRKTQDYFIALADADPEGVQHFIAAGGAGSRLTDEACLKLWDIRLADTKSTLAQLRSALDTIASRCEATRRSEILLNLADALEAVAHAHRDALVDHALKLAINQSARASGLTAIHDVHVRIGRRALAAGDMKLARRHLLSAAFGMPKNAECNFYLGELYSETGQLRRAWSRYFQALLDEKLEDDDPLRPKAKRRLAELTRDPEMRKTFDMQEAEEYMEGRLAASEFHANTRYRFVEKRHPHHARLVELFIDSTQINSGGLQLAFQALGEFFEGEEVALLAWHIDDVMQHDSAKQRIEWYDGKSAPLAVIDGVTRIETPLGNGKIPSQDATRNYPPLRDACLPKKAPDSTDWQIEGKLSREGTKLTADLAVRGGESTDGLRFIAVVCEHSVMSIEKNGVFFHRYVVRDALTPAQGIGLDKVAIKPRRFEADVSKATAEDEQAGYIDPKQLYVVTMIQRVSDTRVLATRTFTLTENP